MVGGPAVPRMPADTLQTYYYCWVVREALVGRASLLEDPYQFVAQGLRPGLAVGSLPLAVPFALLSPLGSAGAYNALVFLSFPLAGLAAYAWLRQAGAPSLGSAAVAAGYALSHVRLDPLFEGQTAGFAPTLAPLVFLSLDRVLTRGRLGDGVRGGMAFLGLAMLETHYGYFLGGLLPLYAAARVPGLATPRRLALGPLLVFAAFVALGAGWLGLLGRTLLAGSVAEAGRSLAEIRANSPEPGALLEWNSYGGRALALLAVSGVLFSRGDRTLRAFWAGVAALGLVLSLGPTLPGIPLYETLHRWVPGFGFIRNVPRFGFITLLGVTALGGYGARALAAWLPPKLRSGAGLALLAAMIVDGVPRHGIAVMHLEESSVYAVLRADARRVLYVPVLAGDNVGASAYLYHPTRTRVPMLNGYSPAPPREYQADVARPLQALNVGDVGPPEHARLREFGVTHVVLDRAVPPVGPFPFALTRDRLARSAGLALVQAADPLWLFRVLDAPRELPASPTSPAGLFAEAEDLARETGEIVADPEAIGGRQVTARAGVHRAGRLLSGLEVVLPRGAYRLSLRTRGGLGRLVVTANGRRPLATPAWDPSATWVDVSLTFRLLRAEPVRVEVDWDGRADLSVDAVSLVFADRPEPEWAFEVETLEHWGRERPDQAASAGRAVLADPARHAGLAVVLGPSRRFPAGHLRLTLAARLAEPAAGPLLVMTVMEPGGPVHATRTVDAAELSVHDYRVAELTFSLVRPTVLDFPVEYLGRAPVFLDRLAVMPDGRLADRHRW
jgi:hypothetical protein